MLTGTIVDISINTTQVVKWPPKKRKNSSSEEKKYNLASMASSVKCHQNMPYAKNALHYAELSKVPLLDYNFQNHMVASTAAKSLLGRVGSLLPVCEGCNDSAGITMSCRLHF